MKNLLVAFGILDLFSFYNSYKKIPYVFDKHGQFSILNTILILTITSLLVTAILSILRNKTSIYAYYIQLPFRVLFFIFTVGFLLKFVQNQYPSETYYMIIGLIVFIELARLLITINIQKKFFKEAIAPIE